MPCVVRCHPRLVPRIWLAHNYVPEYNVPLKNANTAERFTQADPRLYIMAFEERQVNSSLSESLGAAGADMQIPVRVAQGEKWLHIFIHESASAIHYCCENASLVSASSLSPTGQSALNRFRSTTIQRILRVKRACHGNALHFSKLGSNGDKLLQWCFSISKLSRHWRPIYWKIPDFKIKTGLHYRLLTWGNSL